MSDIQVYVEHAEGLERCVRVVVPKHQTDQRKKDRLAETAKKVHLDGFRPGKIPMHMVDKLYGRDVWAEVVRELLEESVWTALQEKALKPVPDSCVITPIKAEPGDDFEYTVHLEVLPKISVPSLKNVSLVRLKAEITDADIRDVLEKIRHYDVNDEAQRADINHVAQQTDIANETVDALHPKIRQLMQEMLDSRLRAHLKKQVAEKLIALYPIEQLPQTFLKKEFQRLQQAISDQQSKHAEQNGTTVAPSEEVARELWAMANRSVTLDLLFASVAKAYQLEVDDNQLLKEAARFFGVSQLEPSIQKSLYKNKNILLNIRAFLLEEQIFDKLLEDVEYTEQTLTYHAAMTMDSEKATLNTDRETVKELEITEAS